MQGQTITVEQISDMYGLRDRPQGAAWTMDEAYAYCRHLCFSHYENFPVGSVLIPKKMRPHVFAIYAFARVADDFSDEAKYEGRRMEHLEEWERLLQACYQGQAGTPIFMALADTAEKRQLPIELFQGLLTAFKRDVTVNRYADWNELLNEYCRFSANPVGRLILHLFDYRDEERLRLSDHICTGLQLINFWQDVAIDLQKDRIYIPQNAMRSVDYSEEELFAHAYDDRFQALMGKLGHRTWQLMEAGYPLLRQVQWPLSAELRFTWLGGMEVLARNRKNAYNMFEKRPKLRKGDFVMLALRALLPVEQRRRAYKHLFEC